MDRTLRGTSECFRELHEFGRGKPVGDGVVAKSPSISPPFAATFDRHVACPRCGSENTRVTSPFGGTVSEMLFQCQGLKVCIPDVGGEDIQSVKCSVGQGNSDALSGDHTSIVRFLWVRILVAIFRPNSLSSEVHLHVKD